ncbi:MAG: ATP-binding protein [Gemmatimonadaceae bacterium]|nr:ATP-binding protein [Gemmatimonadaceae bacterium]
MPEGRRAWSEPPVPRIVVTGSESTGKTTLARQLAEALGTAWLPEFARTHAQQLQRALTADDVSPIATGQLATEEAAMAEWRERWGVASGGTEAPPLILDTDVVSTTVYAEHYYGECPPWIWAAARERLAPLYLLCTPDLPWLADGVRDRPAARRQLHNAFSARLAELGARVLPVAGTGAARLEVALAAVRGWRAAVAQAQAHEYPHPHPHEPSR